MDKSLFDVKSMGCGKLWIYWIQWECFWDSGWWLMDEMKLLTNLGNDPLTLRN